MKDLVIVGGGLAGLSLANLLGEEFRVTLIEKENYPFHKVCGEYISNESRSFLETLGIPLNDWDLPEIDRLLLSAPSGKTLRSPLGLGGFGVSRYKLDDALRQLAEHKGVEVLQGTKVLSVEHRGETFSVQTDKGMLESRYVVGAQGKRSSLDKQMDRPFMQQRTDYLAVKYHIKHPDIPTNEIALHNFERGYCGVSRVEDGRSCLCYLASVKTLQREGNIESLEREVLSKNPYLRTLFREAEFLYSEPLVISRFSFSAKEQARKGVLFAGDAAGLITPLCGNGMSMAMHGAYLLAPLLEKGLSGQLSVKELEQNYRASWQQTFGARLSAGRAIQSLFGRNFLTEAFVRGIRPLSGVQRKIISWTHGKDFMQ